MFRFQKAYFLLTVLFFLIEVLIAMYVHDNFIRPYFGDFLVVILMYCFLKSFADPDTVLTALAVLLFSYLIEVLQYLNFVERLGLANSEIARIVIGTSFAWMDILAYTTGIMAVLWFESSKTGILILKDKKK